MDASAENQGFAVTKHINIDDAVVLHETLAIIVAEFEPEHWTHDPEPLFRRMETEMSAIEAEAANEPVQRARALIAARRMQNG